MKERSLFISLLSLTLGLSACNDIIVFPPLEDNTVIALAVDYTTNKFIGGYTIGLPGSDTSFEIETDYNSPGDFGDITLYEKAGKTKLFAGTIIWMGKGERTFPEKITAPDDFIRLNNTVVSRPELIPVYNVDDRTETKIDYEPVWKAVSSLHIVSWLNDTAPPVYIYLYQPSVGMGNPEDWYWLIFLKH